MTRGPKRWGVAALALVLAGCGGPGSPAVTNRLSLQIDLRTTQVVAGHPIKGDLVINNPKVALNLREGTGLHCQPGFAVILMHGSFRNGVNFAMDCSTRPLVIRHGVSRFPITVTTMYNTCVPTGGGPASINTPPCLSGDRIPPLPRGSYDAVIEWDSSVPLPRPAPVPVTLS